MSEPSRTAWVTGASSGIGRAVALGLAAEGWTVAVSARSGDKLAELEAEQPGKIVSYPLDVTDRDAALLVASRIQAAHGPIELAIFSAGTYRRDSATRFNSQALADVMTLNVIGTGHCLEAVVPGMVKNRSGRIAVIASVAGYVGLGRRILRCHEVGADHALRGSIPGVETCRRAAERHQSRLRRNTPHRKERLSDAIPDRHR